MRPDDLEDLLDLRPARDIFLIPSLVSFLKTSQLPLSDPLRDLLPRHHVVVVKIIVQRSPIFVPLHRAVFLRSFSLEEVSEVAVVPLVLHHVLDFF